MVFHITILLCCQLAGEFLVLATGMPIPGPVAGMVILFAGLALRGVVPDDLQTIGNTLLSNLSLLFVPAGTGIIVHGALIARDGLAVSAALIVSTLLTIAVTALVLISINRWQGKTEGGSQ